MQRPKGRGLFLQNVIPVETAIYTTAKRPHFFLFLLPLPLSSSST